MGAIAPKEDAKGGRFLTPFAQWVQLLRNGCNCSEKCTPITRKKCPFGQLLGGFAPKNGGSQQVKYWVLLLRIMHEMKTDMAIANYVEVPDDEIATLYFAPPKETKWRENTGRALFTEKQITPMVWDKLYKRSFLKHHHLQFIPGICCEDVPFTYNCYFKANRCLVSDIQLYIYRKRSGSITDQYSQRFAHDTSIAIGEIWKLRQQEGISTEEYNRLEHNCFFYFHKLILSTLKHIPKLSNRLRIMDDLAKNAPDLSFTNGKYQKWITVLYRFSPRLLMILWVLRWKYLKQI